MNRPGNFVDAAGASALYRSRSMNGTDLGLMKRGLAAELAVMAVAAIVLAFLGPFGMSALPLGTRLLDWSLFAAGGYAFFRPVVAAAHALSAQAGLPVWAALAVACALASLPTTLLVTWIIAGLEWSRLTIADLAGFYPRVLLLGAVVTALQVLLQRPAPPAGPPAPIAGPQPELPASPRAPALLAQLPPGIGRDLLYLENEDHYVRAHTPLGSALILMRMRDAAEDLEPLGGARVHRSWWVARHAVAEVVRRDRAVALRLVDGREVPVSRAMVPMLRAQGWL